MSDINTYETLITEFIDQRNAIKLMIADLEKIKKNIDKLFPETIDKRYLMFFETKIKSMTELFRIILDMRKEIIKNTKDEFELRRKISGDDGSSDFEELFDIKKMAEKIDGFRKERDKLEQKTNMVLITEVSKEAITEISEEVKNG